MRSRLRKKQSRLIVDCISFLMQRKKLPDENIENSLKKWKTTGPKLPYGALMVLVKEKGKLKSLVDYQALNKITKRNNTPVLRAYEMFDGICNAKFTSKIDLEKEFHQIKKI